MRNLIFVAAACMSLAGCVSPEQQRGEDLALDSNRCASLGFQPGSSQMAQCMDTAAATRATDKNRNDRALQAQQDRIADDNARTTADFNDRLRRSQNETSPASSLPSAAGISGMQCSGSGDDQSCDARGQMCSDGAIRDDCSFAPDGQ